jgi:hypothetical protein
MERIDVMLEPLRALMTEVGGFVPRLALAMVILLVGWLLAKALRLVVVKALRAVNFHVVTERAGIDGFLRQGGSERDGCDLFGSVAYWFAIVAALMVAFSSLQVAAVTDLLAKVLLFFPRLLVALLILVFGSYFAQFVGRSAAGHWRSAGGDADLIGRLAQYAVMAFVLLLALDHLDLGGGLIQQTFLILLAGIVLALALAFGLGGRERAARLLEHWLPGRAGPPPPGRPPDRSVP